ncbi:hypothetical protein AMTR_s00051p00202490 [Amborella trichopoda]|uniref:Uncharacterized protein n=1 Tax=Amborella trichopoda TaxID=13333 RepID=U5D5I1_AMBTC|nr:hypothetical protein AMTR_s00051p00202490 [Amborella trichopoda]
MSALLKERADRKGGRKRKGTKKSKSASPRLARRTRVSKKGLLTSDASPMSSLVKRARVGVRIASATPITLILALVVEPEMIATRSRGSSLSSSNSGCESEGPPSTKETPSSRVSHSKLALAPALESSVLEVHVESCSFEPVATSRESLPIIVGNPIVEVPFLNVVDSSAPPPSPPDAKVLMARWMLRFDL